MRGVTPRRQRQQAGACAQRDHRQVARERPRQPRSANGQGSAPRARAEARPSRARCGRTAATTAVASCTSVIDATADTRPDEAGASDLDAGHASNVAGCGHSCTYCVVLASVTRDPGDDQAAHAHARLRHHQLDGARRVPATDALLNQVAGSSSIRMGIAAEPGSPELQRLARGMRTALPRDLLTLAHDEGFRTSSRSRGSSWPTRRRCAAALVQKEGRWPRHRLVQATSSHRVRSPWPPMPSHCSPIRPGSRACTLPRPRLRLGLPGHQRPPGACISMTCGSRQDHRMYERRKAALENP